VSGASAPTNAAASADSAYGKLDVVVAHVRKRNTDAYAVKSAAGIDEASFVRIGGIEQWITIRGQNRANPVLLFLHGGPGDVTSPWGYAYVAPWYTQFTVVEWDQRGAGRTLRKSGPSIAPTITVDRLVDDGIELSDYLRKHLGKEKIFIVGHSFGSTIGTLMARARPDLFFAYVGTAQVADTPRAEAFAYEALFKKAQASVNQRAKEELAQIGPPPRSSG
jgi:pimeloyl-ACP methyl ester carboxylesterase